MTNNDRNIIQTCVFHVHANATFIYFSVKNNSRFKRVETPYDIVIAKTPDF